MLKASRWWSVPNIEKTRCRASSNNDNSSISYWTSVIDFDAASYASCLEYSWILLSLYYMNYIYLHLPTNVAVLDSMYANSRLYFGTWCQCEPGKTRSHVNCTCLPCDIGGALVAQTSQAWVGINRSGSELFSHGSISGAGPVWYVG